MIFHLFDAKEENLGRIASQVAFILQGKNRPSFAPHKDAGEAVVIVNSDKISVTGSKMEGKIYYRFSGYLGGIKQETLENKLKKDSREVLREAVKGMLPNNKLRKLMLKRLFVYKNEKHPHKIDIDHTKK